MKRFIAGQVIALAVALVAVGTTAAFAIASDGSDGVSTRHTYVVGGEVVHPLASKASEGSAREAASAPSRAGSTRYGYVVGGELIVTGR